MDPEGTYQDGQYYELVRDVVNPKPDRRCKHEWLALTVWSKGTRFRVTMDRTLGNGASYLRLRPLVRFGRLSEIPLCVDSNGRPTASKGGYRAEQREAILPALRLLTWDRKNAETEADEQSIGPWRLVWELCPNPIDLLAVIGRLRDADDAKPEEP